MIKRMSSHDKGAMSNARSWATFCRGIVDELFVMRRHRVMSWSRASVYLLMVTACTAWWYRADVVTPIPFASYDQHAVDSLNVAVNRAFCGFPSRLSRDAQIASLFKENGSLLTLPVSTVIVNRWQRIDLYCATVTQPFLNNENSLMLLESWILRFVPNVSLADIGWIMLALKMTIVLLFCLALLRGGMSVLVCVGVVQIAAAILHQMQPLAYSLYSFFVPVTVLPIAFYSLTATASRRIPVRMIVALVGGVLAAYGANMRTSYLPMHLAVFLLYLLAAAWRPAERRQAFGQRLVVSVAAAALFAAGYGVFHYSLISNEEAGAAAFKAELAARVARLPVAGSRPPASTYPPMPYHLVWHPLVLSLALPPNPLSKREGILWHDATGLELARRVDPSAEYLGSGYEPALSTYYFGLWRQYPAEMRQIYIEKFKLAGRSMIDTAQYPSRWIVAAMTALAYVPNGFWLLAGLVATSGASLWWHVCSGNSAILAVTELTCVGALLVVESAIIIPAFQLSHHSTLLFACSVTTLFLGQLVVSVPVSIGERLVARRTLTAIAAGA